MGLPREELHRERERSKGPDRMRATPRKKRRERAEYVFHVFQMTSEKSVFCPKYVEYGGIRMEYMNTYSKRGPKMHVFRIKFSSLREFST